MRLANICANKLSEKKTLETISASLRVYFKQKKTFLGVGEWRLFLRIDVVGGEGRGFRSWVTVV